MSKFKIFLSGQLILFTMLCAAFRPFQGLAAENALLGRWKLRGDVMDSSGHSNHGENHGIDTNAPGPDGKPNGAARFDGKRAYIKVPSSRSLQFDSDDFTITVWVHTDDALDDVIGDLVSKFDPVHRRGFNWCIKNGHGVTTSQPNFRNIHFGIDANTEPKWTDCGRPGNAVYIMAMAVHDGNLFVGTCEGSRHDTGHVYRYAGGTRWVDCGNPDKSNAVTALAVHSDQLYAGTGRYRMRGSGLVDSLNSTVGGRVLRYEGDGKWVDCGHIGEADAIGGLGVFRGELFATSMYEQPAFFRYVNGRDWEAKAVPNGGRRISALGVYNGSIYAASLNGCDVYRFDGKQWSDAITLEPVGQTYSFEVHGGALYVGTWRNGRVYRTTDGETWTNTGRLGTEQEVMGMAVHNGKLYAGTLPLAEVYRYDEGGWTNLGQLDRTPDVQYRRVWSMTVFQGRLFCGTLPSGHIHSLAAGASVTHDRGLDAGWHHLAAVREGDRLKLFIDGKQAAVSEPLVPSMFDLSTDAPLKIGFGGHDYFRGSLSDLRLYGRALAAEEISREYAAVKVASDE